MLLVDIETRAVTGGHESLALVWAAEVPVPYAIDDSKDLGFFPISRHISLGATTLGGSATTTTTATTTTSAAATLAHANTRDPGDLLETRIIANAVQEEGGSHCGVVLHATIIADDSKGDLEFPSLDPMQEMAHLGFFTQARVRRGGCLKVGSPGLEAGMLRNIQWKVLLRVLGRPENCRELALQSNYHALDVVVTKEATFQNEMSLTTTTLLMHEV